MQNHGKINLESEISGNVPRGTNEKILTFVALLKKWNKSINLLSAQELEDKARFWKRHILDSLQLSDYITHSAKIIDIGSGGGFPAMILAASGYHHITCIESDTRKCEFLKEAARQMQVQITIINQRVEDVKPADYDKADIITARAWASVNDILRLTTPWRLPDTNYVLLKGKQVQEEIIQAELQHQFDYEIKPSMTDEEGYIVIIRQVSDKG